MAGGYLSGRVRIFRRANIILGFYGASVPLHFDVFSVGLVNIFVAGCHRARRFQLKRRPYNATCGSQGFFLRRKKNTFMRRLSAPPLPLRRSEKDWTQRNAQSGSEAHARYVAAPREEMLAPFHERGRFSFAVFTRVGVSVDLPPASTNGYD